MDATAKRFDVSGELAKLKHGKKNQSLQRLPANAAIQRRPINHAPVASPFAGARVQKVVYVSSKTPLMSAVKRVKRLLHEIEKRATQDVKLIDNGERVGLRKLAEARERLAKDGEEVLVKASGRAMQQALSVGEWFRTKESEIRCKVEVTTGSVSVVDDVVEGDGKEEDEEEEIPVEQQEDSIILEGGETTLELLGSTAKSVGEQASGPEQKRENNRPSEAAATGESKTKRRRRKRKKRATYDSEDLPEQRLRWIKTVEVAISFKA
jgi:ribonuclease P/MRP protein subunit POP7